MKVKMSIFPPLALSLFEYVYVYACVFSSYTPSLSTSIRTHIHLVIRLHEK